MADDEIKKNTEANEKLNKTNEKLLSQAERLEKAEGKRFERSQDAVADLEDSILKLIEGNERAVDIEEKKLKSLRKTKQTLESYENLGKQLKTSLFGPLEGLMKRIPEPLRILSKMAIRPMVRGIARRQAQQEKQFQTDQRKGVTQTGYFHEARGREISQKGFYKGSIASFMGLIPGLGKGGRGGGWLGFQDGSDREEETEAGFTSRKVVKHLKKIEENTGKQLKETKEEKKGGLGGLLKKIFFAFILMKFLPKILAALGIGLAVGAAAYLTKDYWEGWWEDFKKWNVAQYEKYKKVYDERPPLFGKEFTEKYWTDLWKKVKPDWLVGEDNVLTKKFWTDLWKAVKPDWLAGEDNVLTKKYWTNLFASLPPMFGKEFTPKYWTDLWAKMPPLFGKEFTVEYWKGVGTDFATSFKTSWDKNIAPWLKKEHWDTLWKDFNLTTPEFLTVPYWTKLWATFVTPEWLTLDHAKKFVKELLNPTLTAEQKKKVADQAAGGAQNQINRRARVDQQYGTGFLYGGTVPLTHADHGEGDAGAPAVPANWKYVTKRRMMPFMWPSGYDAGPVPARTGGAPLSGRSAETQLKQWRRDNEFRRLKDDKRIAKAESEMYVTNANRFTILADKLGWNNTFLRPGETFEQRNRRQGLEEFEALKLRRKAMHPFLQDTGGQFKLKFNKMIWMDPGKWVFFATKDAGGQSIWEGANPLLDANGIPKVPLTGISEAEKQMMRAGGFDTPSANIINAGQNNVGNNATTNITVPNSPTGAITSSSGMEPFHP